ncbi:GTP cyclohydrolase 1 [Rhizina undulata]
MNPQLTNGRTPPLSPLREKAQFCNVDHHDHDHESMNGNGISSASKLFASLAVTNGSANGHGSANDVAMSYQSQLERARSAVAVSHPHLASGPATPQASRPASPYTLIPPVDYDGLSWPSVGTRARLEATPEQAAARLDKLSGAIRTLLECIGEDPDREGLLATPERYAKAMLYFTKGYEENLKNIVNNAVFQEDHDELVIVKDIEIFSLCEHHLVPFTGKMHIGYIPNRKVLGLSKFARIAEMFARRLQLQERLTKQVAMAIEEILQPQGVAVVMESSHFCMVMRGVGKTTATTTTSSMLGVFRKSTRTREEFMHLALRNHR